MKNKPKVIFIYNPTSGRGRVEKNLDFIIGEISAKYGMCDVIRTMSPEHLTESVRESCYKYDYLFFSGGDGTFNMVVNAIPDIERLPVFGFLPGGTTNDMSYNLGISRRNVRKGVHDLLNAEPKRYDVGYIGDTKFIYVADLSSYINAIHITPKSEKKKWGPLAYVYYLLMAFAHSKEYVVYLNGVKYITPMVIISNSKEVASFVINKNHKQDEGKYYACIVKKGPLRGLTNIAYLFAFGVKAAYLSKRIEVVEGSILEILTDEKSWDVDGEYVELSFPAICGYSGRSITVLSNRK